MEHDCETSENYFQVRAEFSVLTIDFEKGREKKTQVRSGKKKGWLSSRANNPLKYSISTPSSTMFQSHRYFSFFLSLSLLLMNYFAFYIIVSTNRSFSSNFKFQRFSFFFLFHCFVTILGWKLRFERRQRDNVLFIPDEDYSKREKKREKMGTKEQWYK